MSRYIEAELAERMLIDGYSVDEIPSAEVEPVRHGYWIHSPDVINPIRCSECNMPAPFAARENEFGDFEICRYPSSYCHECGAKMDGKGNRK